MATDEPPSAEFDARSDLRDQLLTVVGLVGVGVAIGLLVPFIENDFTFVEGVANGISAALLLGAVFLVVMILGRR